MLYTPLIELIHKRLEREEENIGKKERQKDLPEEESKGENGEKERRHGENPGGLLMIHGKTPLRFVYETKTLRHDLRETVYELDAEHGIGIHEFEQIMAKETEENGGTCGDNSGGTR